jgi:NADH:ubiquinone oxidoreductase subunit 6 (subunit J)
VTDSWLVDVVFWLLATGSLVSGWLVFRTDSMVRAAFWLLASFVGVGAIVIMLGAEFIGIVLILMMAGEMLIMAVIMVMFMMNPAGLNPMFMVHQHRASIAAGATAFIGLAIVGVSTSFPDQPVPTGTDATEQLGFELLGGSMLAFQTAGVALLSTMIGAVVLASHRGRYGSAEEGSVEPDLDPPTDPPAGTAGHGTGGTA